MRKGLMVLGAALAAAGVYSCTAIPPAVPASSTNPMEVLQRSPRVYHVEYTAMVDSMETALATTYLAGGMRAERPFRRPADDAPEQGSTRDRALAEYWAARDLLETGADSAAVALLEKALETDPTFMMGHMYLGEVLLGQGRVEDAAVIFARILSHDSRNSRAIAGLARCYLKIGDGDKARSALIDAVIFDRAKRG
jgi:Flp pilus assembly protein TadD